MTTTLCAQPATPTSRYSRRSAHDDMETPPLDLSKFKLSAKSGSALPPLDLSKFKVSAAPPVPASPPQTKGFGGKIMDAAKGVTNFLGLGKTVDTIGTDIARATASPKERSFIKAPTAGEQAGAALNIASTALPFGAVEKTGASILGRIAAPTVAKIGGKIAAGALGGAVIDSAHSLEEGGGPKIGAASVIGALLGGTPLIAKGVSKGADNLSQTLEKINLRLTPTQKTNLGKKLNAVTNWLSEKQIVGSPEARFEKVDAVYNQTESKLQNFLETNNTATGRYVSKKGLIEELQGLKAGVMR